MNNRNSEHDFIEMVKRLSDDELRLVLEKIVELLKESGKL